MWLLFPLSLSVFNVNVWGTLEVGPGFVVAGPIEFIGVVNGGLGGHWKQVQAAWLLFPPSLSVLSDGQLVC